MRGTDECGRRSDLCGSRRRGRADDARNDIQRVFMQRDREEYHKHRRRGRETHRSIWEECLYHISITTHTPPERLVEGNTRSKGYRNKEFILGCEHRESE